MILVAVLLLSRAFFVCSWEKLSDARGAHVRNCVAERADHLAVM